MSQDVSPALMELAVYFYKKALTSSSYSVIYLFDRFLRGFEGFAVPCSSLTAACPDFVGCSHQCNYTSVNGPFLLTVINQNHKLSAKFYLTSSTSLFF